MITSRSVQVATTTKATSVVSSRFTVWNFTFNVGLEHETMRR